MWDFFFQTQNNIFIKVVCLYGYFFGYYSCKATKMDRDQVDLISSPMFKTNTLTGLDNLKLHSL